MQNRFTLETPDTKVLNPDLADFTVRRMRLRFDGNVLDSRLLYKVQLSFTRGDMDYDRTNYPNILRDAAVGWKFTDYTTLWYGQTKLPGNRQRVVSSGSQQFVDRSLLNATFNLDRDTGAQIYHRIGDEQPLWIKLALSNGTGRSTDNNDNGLAYTSRVEWLPLGSFNQEGDYFESDLFREPKPKISIGGVYSINKKSNRPGGQIGRQYTTKDLNTDIETWLLDSLLKYRGFSWATEYARRWTPNPVFMDGATKVTIYRGMGLSSQAGYIFDNNIEPALRFTKLWADKETLAAEKDYQQYTMALSKYFDNHKVKIQTDISFLEEMNHVQNFYGSNWMYRIQLEIGI